MKIIVVSHGDPVTEGQTRLSPGVKADLEGMGLLLQRRVAETRSGSVHIYHSSNFAALDACSALTESGIRFMLQRPDRGLCGRAEDVQLTDFWSGLFERGLASGRECMILVTDSVCMVKLFQLLNGRFVNAWSESSWNMVAGLLDEPDHKHALVVNTRDGEVHWVIAE